MKEFIVFVFFFQAEDGIRDHCVTGVQTCALPISYGRAVATARATFSGVRPAERMIRHCWLPSSRATVHRSEERRVGKECRARWWTDDLKKKDENPDGGSQRVRKEEDTEHGWCVAR